jgi:choice-of-anchor B domain-containing protein
MFAPLKFFIIMRRLYFLFLLISPFCLLAQTNVSFQSVTYFPGQSLANVWGYASGGQEYALVGAQTGMAIVNITNPAAPVVITTIPGPNNLWKEIKTYQHYAYVVSEGGSGVIVVDLTNLPGTNLIYHSVFPDVAGQGTITKAHALHIDEAKGYLYLYGTNLYGGKAIVCNLNVDPYNPTYSGYYNAVGYAHDGYANNDTLFAAHISAGKFSIVNASNKSSLADYGPPVTTPNAFTHNTWRSGNTIFTTDEKTNAYLASYNITDPADVTLMDKIQLTPGSGSIVHNTYIKSNYAVTSWYRDGIAIVDVARPGNMVVTGNYDTYSGSGDGFDGCWGVYPYFPSGNIIASNIYGAGAHSADGELYVLTPTYVRGCYLEGVVKDASTNNPILGVLVELLISGVGNETTPTNGEYKMARNGGGTYTLRVSKTGYYTQNITVTISSGVLITQDVFLVQASLPVELLRFNAGRGEQNTALLTWETANETDNAGFEIQKSTDGNTWEAIGFEKACDKNLTECSYQFETAELVPGTWFFRLAQSDTDGKITFTEWRSVKIENDRFKVTIAPNPVSASSVLTIHTGQKGPADFTVSLYGDNLQQVLFTKNYTQVEGEIIMPLSMEQYPAGFYLIRVAQGAEVNTIPLVKN